MDSREAPLFLVLQGQLTVCYCPLQPWGRHSANPYGFGAAGIAARFWACRELLRTSRSNRARRMLTIQLGEKEGDGGRERKRIPLYWYLHTRWVFEAPIASRMAAPRGFPSELHRWHGLDYSYLVNLTHRSHRSQITRFIIRGRFGARVLISISRICKLF